jgi:hypothetical protein
MQNITVVGKDSAARTAVIIALNSNFKINDLLPEQIYFDDLSAADLVIYIAEQPDQQIIDRLHECGKSIILIGIYTNYGIPEFCGQRNSERNPIDHRIRR